MTNTTPRELDADELDRMRERAKLNGAQPFDTYTIRALLAHVAAVDARCRAYEAALREIRDHKRLIDTEERPAVWISELQDMVNRFKSVAADALAATDGSGRDGNGEAR